MGYPKQHEIKKALKKIEGLDGTLALPENPSHLERFRFDLHQKFVKYFLNEKISQRELAERLGIDEAKVSKILHHRIDEFSTDRLISLYEKIDGNLRLKVS